MICILGFKGSLVMSAIKRDIGIKDFGVVIEGHGGILDRIDSLCFAAPIFFHLVRYLFRAVTNRRLAGSLFHFGLFRLPRFQESPGRQQFRIQQRRARRTTHQIVREQA